MKKNHIIIYLCIILYAHSNVIFAMNNKAREYYGIIVHDENNNGGDDYTQCGINNLDPSDYTYITSIENASLNDLGQEQCIDDFEKKFQEIHMKNSSKSRKYLAYAIGQGASTLINWLAQKSCAEQNELIACLFLEATVASGLAHIMSSVQKQKLKIDPSVPDLLKPFVMEGLQLACPWIEKTLKYPAYKQNGKQAFVSAQKISPDIPIIIAHNQTDPLPINGSRQLYCTFKKNGNKKVYLLEITSEYPIHFNIFAYDRDARNKINALQMIYKKNGLPFNTTLVTHSQSSINVTQFQPSIEEVDQRMNNN